MRHKADAPPHIGKVAAARTRVTNEAVSVYLVLWSRVCACTGEGRGGGGGGIFSQEGKGGGKKYTPEYSVNTEKVAFLARNKPPLLSISIRYSYLHGCSLFIVQVEVVLEPISTCAEPLSTCAKSTTTERIAAYLVGSNLSLVNRRRPGYSADTGVVRRERRHTRR